MDDDLHLLLCKESHIYYYAFCRKMARRQPPEPELDFGVVLTFECGQIRHVSLIECLTPNTWWGYIHETGAIGVIEITNRDAVAYVQDKLRRVIKEKFGVTSKGRVTADELIDGYYQFLKKYGPPK